MKVWLDQAGYISGCLIFEDVRINSSNELEVQIIPLGDTVWRSFIVKSTTQEAIDLVNGFTSFTGTLPINGFRWLSYKYRLSAGELIEESQIVVDPTIPAHILEESRLIPSVSVIVSEVVSVVQIVHQPSVPVAIDPSSIPIIPSIFEL